MKKAGLVLLVMAAFVVTMMLYGALGRWHAAYTYNGGTMVPSWLIPAVLGIAITAAVALAQRLRNKQ